MILQIINGNSAAETRERQTDFRGIPGKGSRKYGVKWPRRNDHDETTVTTFTTLSSQHAPLLCLGKDFSSVLRWTKWEGPSVPYLSIIDQGERGGGERVYQQDLTIPDVLFTPIDRWAG